MLLRDNRNFYIDQPIRFYECDSRGQAKLATMLRYVADIAGIDYTVKGYSHSYLWERNMVFLLSRVSLRFVRMPKSEEIVTFETWENKIKGVQFFRDFSFYDEAGQLLGEASTAWVLVHPYERTILKPSVFCGEISPNPDKEAEVLPVGRLKPIGEFTEVGRRKIVYSDIDGNNHTYNAVYASIACDFLPAELISREITDFRINFKQEAVLGEELVIKLAVSGNTAMVIGELPEVVSFECEFVFG